MRSDKETSQPLPHRTRVGIAVWTIDPEGVIRFLLRHNKPFGGHSDEWNIFYGTLESNESMIDAAIRELREESGIIISRDSVVSLEKELSYSTPTYTATINYFSVMLPSIDQEITLNEESIGYDWVIWSDLRRIIKYQEQISIFSQIGKISH